MGRKDTWSKPNIENLVAIKRMDLSMFQHGTHIPLRYRKYFLNWLDIQKLIKGESKTIKLIFDDFTGQAEIRNLNIKQDREMIQIRYNTQITNYLRDKMKDTYELIKDETIKDKEVQEAIEFYYGEEKNEFKVRIVDLKGEGNVKEEEASYIEKDIIQEIHEYISSQGYFYSLETIKNLYLSLKTKAFVILAGISGTGKSKLVELFAEAVGADRENKRYSLIPVRPDWSDGSDLLGFKNIEGKFLKGAFTSIVKNAIDNPKKPHFVCLDEMNLARVEYYFSDVLSLMETRKKIDGKIITEKLFKTEDFGEDDESKKELQGLYIPDNLYIIGTVNIDETTFPFSKKVLDRANTIEFNQVKLEVDFDYIIAADDEIEQIDINNNMFASQYIKIMDCIEEKDLVHRTIEVLKSINIILEEENMHFGYRVRDEICFYVIYAVSEKLMDFDIALDHGILQKILPKIQGSSVNIKTILIDIFNRLNDQAIQSDTYDNDSNIKAKRILDSGNIKYPLTSNKLYKMIRRYELDGFTTFWE